MVADLDYVRAAGDHPRVAVINLGGHPHYRDLYQAIHSYQHRNSGIRPVPVGIDDQPHPHGLESRYPLFYLWNHLVYAVVMALGSWVEVQHLEYWAS